MTTTSGLTYLLGPLVALAVVGILIVLLRWSFSRGHSVVQRRPAVGAPNTYGMLVSVAAPGTYAQAEILRHTLEDGGIRATVAQTADGPRVMVFPQDETAARRRLAG